MSEIAVIPAAEIMRRFKAGESIAAIGEFYDREVWVEELIRAYMIGVDAGRREEAE